MSIKSSDIIFRPNMTMILEVKQQPLTFRLKIPDFLEVYEQKLEVGFKKKIASFINSSKIWYGLAIEKMKEECVTLSVPRLIYIMILSVQNDSTIIFGLGFWADFDEEHGRGLHISEGLKVLAYGSQEIAFCPPKSLSPIYKKRWPNHR